MCVSPGRGLPDRGDNLSGTDRVLCQSVTSRQKSTAMSTEGVVDGVVWGVVVL